MNVCAPAQNARPKTLRIAGMAATTPKTKRDEVFQYVPSPGCYVVEIHPVCCVLDNWHGTALLASKFRPTVLGWPIEVDLHPGLELNGSTGMEPWMAERAAYGLIHREPYYIETATLLLSENAGVVLSMAGGVRALLIAEDEFESSVEIGEPEYFSELGDAVLSDLVSPGPTESTTR